MYFKLVVPGLVAVAVPAPVSAAAAAAAAVPGLKVVVVVAPPGIQAVDQAVQLFSQGRAVMYPKKVRYTERFGIMSRKRFD